MADDFHGGRRIYACSSEIRTGRMPEIMDSQIRDACPPTRCLVGGSNSLDWLILIQEHPIRVQSSLLP